MLLFFLLLTLVALAASATIGDCPGYTATNITQNGNSLTATLSLAGNACNLYGEDIKDLQLLVEYQSGKTKRDERYEKKTNRKQALGFMSRSTIQLNKYIKYRQRFCLYHPAQMLPQMASP